MRATVDADTERQPAVLLVTPDGALRAGLADAFEAAGHEVLMCPGPPQSPWAASLECFGLRRGRCPLAAEATVAVLDMHMPVVALAAPEVLRDLAAFYRSRCEVLVLLEDATASGGKIIPPGAVSVSRDKSPKAVAALVGDVLARRLGRPGARRLAAAQD